MRDDRYSRSGGYLSITLPRSSGGKSSYKIFRLWRSLSRMQRNFVLTLTLLVSLVFCYIFVARYPAESTTSKKYVKVPDHPRHIVVNEIEQRVEDDKLKNNIADFDQEEERRPADGKAADLQDSRDGIIAKPNYPRFKGPQNDRQRAVVDAFKFAWAGYKKHAWGHDQLKPVSKAHSDWFSLGLTIVDSLDTMIIMGLDDEFEEARSWVAESLSYEKNIFVSFFEVTIRVLGGLLSAFHLSGDKMFANKAADLGERLIFAYGPSSAVPFSDVNLQSRSGKQPSWGSDSSLSEVTTVQLEFRDLSRVTGNATFENLSFATSKHVHDVGCSAFDGLCGMFINPKTGKFKDPSTITFGARADSYYEYLLKQWLQTGKTIDWLKDDYVQSIAGMEKHLVRLSEPNKLTFVGEVLPGKVYSPKMDHLACFIGGALALGAMNGLPASHLGLGEAIGHGCQSMYRTSTGLWPEIIHFNMLAGQGHDVTIKEPDAHCLLRPEAIEAWFYLYRATKKKEYQEWGWQAFEALMKHAKVEAGFSSVNNVKRLPVVYRDLMESFFLAETLKYLYLLFDDEMTDIPLDKYVFNTEGHPLPIYER